MNQKIVNCPYCGKILPADILTDTPRKVVKCTVCGSQKNWKCGLKNTANGKVQRYLCRDCGTRFSDRT
ncbi:MAG: hypothetical protein IAX22_07700 [Candidatus Bathyarchaeota archaeon]|nr:hypothetical protein [Candidatus Bathyarchaeota archaeon]